ncbi:uncharacterized protein LOC112173507 isoform X2 [Rosa chinensis]|uniref:uncharacterized protein LOC112173507 isoform X2 n=1 Tax=Rosa chinensis TaxID=74649 RepID=UPI000D087ADD|nr:uncharacterized protein LOC112173507 isoform X2 [Rosa chinensis]
MSGCELSGKRRRLVAEIVQRPCNEGLEEKGDPSHCVAEGCEPLSSVVLKTGCNPKDFKQTCAQLSTGKTKAVDGIGFGPLTKIGCTKLNREICQMLVDNFEVEKEGCCIKIQGRSLSIRDSDFERVMGVRSGGLAVELDGWSEVIKINELTSKIFGENREISIVTLKKNILEREEVDDIVKISFVLYAFAILLCPTRPGYVERKFLIPICDTAAIGTKNWESVCFRHLVDGVLSKSNQKDRLGYMSGCMLFVQLFYFDCVGYSASMVSKSVHPVVAWTNKRCRSMIEWISAQWGSHGGCVYISNSVGAKIGENLEADYGCQLVCESVPEHVSKALFQIYGVQNEIRFVSSKMGCMEANIERVRKIIFEIGKIMREMNVGVRGQLHSYRMKTGNGNEFGSDDDGSVIGIDIEPWQKRPLSSYYDGGSWQEGAYDEAAKEGDRYVEDTGAEVGLKLGPVSTDDGNVGKEEDRFPLKGNLSLTEWTLLKFLFEKPTRGPVKCRDEVARFGEWIMSTADFDCLRPRNKISNKVINISAAYLFEKESDSWFLPTNFGEQACYKNQSSKVETSLASIISECGLHRFNRRLKWCSKILIPVHD